MTLQEPAEIAKNAIIVQKISLVLLTQGMFDFSPAFSLDFVDHLDLY